MDNAKKLERMRIADQEIDSWIRKMRAQPLTEAKTLEFMRDFSVQLGYGLARAIYEMRGDRELAAKLITDTDDMYQAFTRGCDRVEKGLTLDQMPLANVIPLSRAIH